MVRRALVAVVAVVGLVGAAGSGAAWASTGHGCAGRWSVLVSVRTGAVDCAFPDIRTFAVIANGDRGWFVGTDGLDRVGGVLVRRIARLEPDGRLDRSWHGTVPYGDVESLALHGNTLYAGGTFGVEALDAATGRERWVASVPPGPGNDGVSAIAAGAGDVFVDGVSAVDGVRLRDGLAALDPRTGRPLPWRGPNVWSPPPVGGRPAPRFVVAAQTIALHGSRLLLGGAGPFDIHGRLLSGTFALNAQTGAITRWLGSEKAIVGTQGMLPNIDQGGGVTALFAIHGTTLYTFKIIGNPNGPSRYFLTAKSLRSHRTLDWHPRLASAGQGASGQVIAASARAVFVG